MSIKSDRWIRRMAEQHGMIEPFEPGQVREKDGDRIVSYGTSSYGYDVRCSGEFKIFTNINSAVVDPKAFDATSFVDLNSDVCVIPPNSSCWHALSSISAYRVMCSQSAWENRRTRAVASSSTSHRSNRSGKGT